MIALQSYVDSHKDAVQKVVDALVATMHWISTHSAADIADKLPQTYVQNSLVSKADYVSALNQDKGQFLPDGIMPAGGPKTVLAMEELIGAATPSVQLAPTFTNEYALQANKTEGFTTTTTPAGADG